MSAFLRAARLGADGVELDVRLTGDGALAVHHDPQIVGRGPIGALAVRELPDHVPLLAAALAAVDGLTVNIEIKNLPTEPGFDPDERVARLVVELLDDERREAPVVISSFWPGSLDAVRVAAPHLATGLLLADWADPATGVDMAVDAGYRALHLHHSLVSATVVDAAHQAGLAVAAGTVNGSEAEAAMAASRVDTVITDDVLGTAATLEAVDGPADAGGHRAL